MSVAEFYKCSAMDAGLRGYVPLIGVARAAFSERVFDSPRIPEIEPSLLRLSKEEADDELRIELASALALLGTPSCRSTAWTVYREDSDAPERFSIAEILYYQFVILGINDPDLEHWRMEMDQFRRTDAEYSSCFSMFESGSSIFNNAISEEFKVGRNDPCPCGSDRKFKSAVSCPEPS